jgi:hypothetical protein
MPLFSRVRQNVHSTEVSSAHAGLLLGVSGLQRALAIAALYRSRGVQADACLWCVNVTLLHGLDMYTTCCYRYYYPTTCSKCMPSMSSLPRRSKGWSSYNYTSFDMVYNILSEHASGTYDPTSGVLTAYITSDVPVPLSGRWPLISLDRSLCVLHAFTGTPRSHSCRSMQSANSNISHGMQRSSFCL